MATLTADTVQSQILARTRLEIGDYVEGFWQTVVADGQSSRYELGVRAVETDNFTVTVGGVTANPSTYTLDDFRGVVIFNTPPAANAVIVATGDHWQFMNDTELLIYVRTAFLKHVWAETISSPNVDTFGHHQIARIAQGMLTLPEVEWHLVALLAAYEALKVMASDAAYDIDVVTAEGTSLPRSERFQAIMQLANDKLDMYKMFGAQMNVGMFRAQIGTLTRVSLRTGRLVPRYVPREYDDNSPPTRIIEHIDQRPSLQLASSATLQQDIVVPEGKGVSIDVVTGVDLTTATSVIATVTTGAYATSILNLTVVVVTPATGELTVTVPYAVAQTLPAFAAWRAVATFPDGSTPEIVAGTLAIEAAA